jgi:hypothetical protein
MFMFMVMYMEIYMNMCMFTYFVHVKRTVYVR